MRRLFLLLGAQQHNNRTRGSPNNTKHARKHHGEAQGRAKKKKFGNRGADGRAVSKKRKPAQQHDLLSPGVGDAPFDGNDGADLMDVGEEEGKAADEDANDEW